jgi:hypothetical protein
VPTTSFKYLRQNLEQIQQHIYCLALRLPFGWRQCPGGGLERCEESRLGTYRGSRVLFLWLAAFNLWWSFEEFVIDRFGIWRVLPDYKFGRLCVWDLTVAVLIGATVSWLSFKRKKTENVDNPIC